MVAWAAAQLVSPNGGGGGGGGGSGGKAGLANITHPWLRGFGPSPTADCVFPDLAGPSYTSLSTGYGTAHHRYYLDEVLVAVAVVDVTPRYLSSVYVFYDPAISQSLPLGKLTALREIQWVQAAAQRHALHTYLMGYYIENCPKMRYKAEYAPSEILCPVTRAGWVPVGQAAVQLKTAKRAPLVDVATAAAWEGGARLREAVMAGALARTPFQMGKQILSIQEIKELAPAWIADVMTPLKVFLHAVGEARGRFVIVV